jgi:sodium/bile acid cotransporter 7
MASVAPPRPLTGLSRLLSRLRIDTFLLALGGSVLLATLLPVRGAAVEPMRVAVFAAVALLFFLYGARLAPSAVVAGACRGWCSPVRSSFFR